MSVLDSSNFNQTCWLFVFFTYDLCGVFLSSVFCELFILYKAYTIYLTRKNCFRYLKLMSPLNKWYYFKNNYFTLRSKDKVQRRSIRYATHRLMVMHPHTKYHWPIWKDKKVMVRTSFVEKKQKKRKQKRKKISDYNNMSPRLTSYVPWLVPRLKGQINTHLSQWNFYLGDVITIKSLIFFIFNLF